MTSIKQDKLPDQDINKQQLQISEGFEQVFNQNYQNYLSRNFDQSKIDTYFDSIQESEQKKTVIRFIGERDGAFSTLSNIHVGGWKKNNTNQISSVATHFEQLRKKNTSDQNQQKLCQFKNYYQNDLKLQKLEQLTREEFQIYNLLTLHNNQEVINPYNKKQQKKIIQIQFPEIGKSVEIQKSPETKQKQKQQIESSPSNSDINIQNKDKSKHTKGINQFQFPMSLSIEHSEALPIQYKQKQLSPSSSKIQKSYYQIKATQQVFDKVNYKLKASENFLKIGKIINQRNYRGTKSVNLVSNKNGFGQTDHDASDEDLDNNPIQFIN